MSKGNMTVDISVIIPVYNTVNFLRRCVDSVLVQRGDVSLELILVDDGSTDGSATLCDEYAEKFASVKVIHTPNAGPATAKNVGLQQAKGSFVSFIDSDDAVTPMMYSTLLTLARRHAAAVVCCSYAQMNEDGSLDCDYGNSSNVGDEVLMQQELLERFLLKKGVYSQCWTKLYSRDVIERNHITFRDGWKTDEDFLFNLDFFLCTDVAVITSKSLYQYTFRSNSLSRQYSYQHVQAFVDNMNRRLDYTQQQIAHHHPELLDVATIHCLQYYNFMIGRVVAAQCGDAMSLLSQSFHYLHTHARILLRQASACGFSKLGALLALLLPPRLYLIYRKHKVS